MTPLEKLGVLSTLSALAMGEFCGDIDPVENISAEGIVADDPVAECQQRRAGDQEEARQAGLMLKARY